MGYLMDSLDLESATSARSTEVRNAIDDFDGSAEAALVYASLLPWDCDLPDGSTTISEAMQDRLADLWVELLVADYQARHTAQARE